MTHNPLNGISLSESSTPHLTPQKHAPKSPKISVSIDWFQTHNTQTPKLDPGIHGRFEVKHRGRVAEFQNHYEIFLFGERVATLAAHPDKGILNPDCSFLKIDNKFLNRDLKLLVEEINETLCLNFRNVSRVDIACDFNTFKNNLHPETFIERFIPQRKPKYVKLRRSVWSMVGKHERGQRGSRKTENSYSYLRFGNPRSNVCYYLYNKSLEMQEKKNKPWIREKWEADNLDQQQDVWRLEFRIHSCSKGLIDEDAGEELKKFRKAKLFLKELSGKIKRGYNINKIEILYKCDLIRLDEEVKIITEHIENATPQLRSYLAASLEIIQQKQQQIDNAIAYLNSIPKKHKSVTPFQIPFKLHFDDETKAIAKQLITAPEQIHFWNDNKLDATADAKYFGTLDVLENFHEFYGALFHHYFDFRYNDQQEKKRRMKRLPLLDIAKPDKSLMDLAEKMESNRTDRMLLKKLVSLNDELRAKAERTETPPAFVLDALKVVTKHYSHTRELEEYIKKKFPDFSFEPETDKHINSLFAEQQNFIEINGQLLEPAPF